MLEMLKDELYIKGAFNSYNPLLANLCDVIPENIPLKMKQAIAVSEMTLFVSQLRRNIELADGTLVPTNAITFILAPSGASKDRCCSTIRRCFSDGYKLIKKERDSLAHKRAVAEAEANGSQAPETDYKKYYKEPKPIFVSTSTTEGLISHMNQLESDGIGAGYIFSNEFGTELQSSAIITENIKLLSEMYDLGRKEVKVVKSADSQSKEINCLPFSALFMSSFYNILYDEKVKEKFKAEFTTKLARRSFFNFNNQPIIPIQYASIEEMIADETAKANKSIELTKTLDDYFADVCRNNLFKTGTPIEITKEANDLFYVYKKYNEELSEQIPATSPISKLARKHNQWKALKLAGVFALVNGNNQITLQDYCEAITYIESLTDDMLSFEKEMRKEKYEIFVDYIKTITKDNKANISLHQLKQLQYIPSNGSPTSKLKDLVMLATSLDKEGIYTVEEDNSITYEHIVKTDIIGASYLYCPGTKEERQYKCSTGYEYDETTFPSLAELLKDDFAFSPFKFKDGVRNKDAIDSGTKWICFDIDASHITDEETHFILQNINHHIARTSDDTNPFKFRLLVELDAVVNIKDELWKKFIQSVAEFIGIKIDNLPKSQIFFGYKGREVLSVIDKETISTKEHIMLAMSQENRTDISKLTKTEKETMLANRYDTFIYAYESANGSGSRNLIRAMYHAKDLGMDNNDIISLLTEINEYWSSPMDNDRFQKTIISQVKRL